MHTICKIQHNLMDSQYTIESIIHMYAKFVQFIALQMAGIHFWIMRFHYTRISILNGKYLVWSSLPIHRCAQYTLERHNLFGNNKLNGVLIGWWWHAFIINAKVNVKIIDVYTIFYFSLKEKPCILNSWVTLYVSQGIWDQQNFVENSKINAIGPTNRFPYLMVNFQRGTCAKRHRKYT